MRGRPKDTLTHLTIPITLATLFLTVLLLKAVLTLSK